MNTRRVAPVARLPRIVRWSYARGGPSLWRRAVVSCGVIALASVCVTARARCDDPDDPDDDQAVAVPRIVLSEQQFDQMVFGRDQRVVRNGADLKVNYGNPSATVAGRRMESQLESEVKSIDDRCRLSAAQKDKIRLAGRGDIARWLGRVSELRKKYAGTTMDQQQYAAVMRELQSFRLTPQFGVFGETSLLRKTLRKTLTDEQLPQYQAMVRERTIQAVENALRAWPAKVALVGEKRKKFVDALVDHGSLPQTNSPYFQYIVWFEAGRLEDQLKPLLDESQWQWLQQQVGNARRVEPALRQAGQWPVAAAAEDESPPDAAKD